MGFLRYFAIAVLITVHPAQAQQDPQVKAAVRSDIDKAEAITFAQANLRINVKNDTELQYALLHVRNAKTPADVHNVFLSAKDNIDEVLDRDTMVSLFKAGASFFGASGATYLIDGGNWLAKRAEQNDGKLQFSNIPTTYSSTILLGGIQNASPEVKEAIAREIATHIGKNFDETIDAVTTNRILENPNNRSAQGKFFDREFYTDQLNNVKMGLSDVKDALDKQIAGQQAQALKQAAAAELANETEHLKAGVYLTGLILGPVVGPESARKITTIGNNLIQMNTAIKQFGPNGLTPDKLLMFTNFATAGFAIVGMIVASQQEDPTMTALKQIMSQLEDIKKQLERIEGKIDNLSDLVLVGFERTLTNLAQIEIEFDNFQRAVLGRIQEQSQRDAIKIFLNYVSSDPEHYRLALQCDQQVKIVEDQICLNDFARLLSDYTIFTDLQLPRIPDIVSPVWSNQMLSLKGITFGPDSHLVLEQFSYPIYLANDPKVFRSMIAYNQSAASAYSTAVMSTPLIPTLANPEILATALKVVVATFKIRPSLQGEHARQLLEQAISRIQNVESMLTTTVGDERAMRRLWEAMADDINGYQDKVNAILADIRKFPYNEQKYRFNGANKSTIQPCPSMAGYSPLQAPVDPMTKQGMEKFVDPLYWAAEEMHLGRVVQCYEMSNGAVIKVGDDWNYKVIGRVRVFFNRSPALDATKISAWELSPVATAFSPSSLPIATMQYVTNRHFSTWFGSTLSVFSHAWGSPPLNVHDVYECRWPQPKGFGIGRQIYDPNCKAGPDGDSPVQALVNKSNDIDAEKGTQTKATIEAIVHEKLKEVVGNRSSVWDPSVLDFKEGPDPKILQTRDVVTKPLLKEAIGNYTLKHLLAKNLLMVSSYHENRVASCLKVLDDYSPEAIVVLAADRVMQQKPSISDEFLSAMTNVNSQCLEHSVHPELAHLKQELNDLR